MKKYLIALALVCTSYLSAASWMINAATINQGTSSGVQADVTLAYYPKIKKVVAAWADTATSVPYYSVYDGIANTWTPAQLISMNLTFTATDNVNLQSFPFKKIVVAAWIDSNSGGAFSSYFDGVSWSPVVQIGTQLSQNFKSNVGLAYDKVTHSVFAAWSAGPPISPSIVPYYSILDPTTLTWSAPAPIDPTSAVNEDINLTYDIVQNQVVAAWGSFVMDQHPLPVYSSYSSGWLPAALPIPPGSSSGVQDDVTLLFDRSLGATVGAWAGFSNQEAYLSRYQSGAWLVLPNNISSITATSNFNLGYDFGTGEVFAAWQDTSTNLPFYIISPALTGSAIPPGLSSGVIANVSLIYDQHAHKMVAAWGDRTKPTHTPYYNTYQ